MLNFLMITAVNKCSLASASILGVKSRRRAAIGVRVKSDEEGENKSGDGGEHCIYSAARQCGVQMRTSLGERAAEMQGCAPCGGCVCCHSGNTEGV